MSTQSTFSYKTEVTNKLNNCYCFNPLQTKMTLFLATTITIIFLTARPAFSNHDTKYNMAEMRRYLQLNPESCKWCNMKSYVDSLKKNNEKPKKPTTPKLDLEHLDIFDLPYYISMQTGNSGMESLLDKLPDRV
ncbi:unnamed protein product [Parnassius mnemosyne]|uniref:Uncharacterized protein n=1 Tax=Parnassius mnemosyne TaxID=213953 RepID=A0AAV1L6C2_9NEOP